MASLVFIIFFFFLCFSVSNSSSSSNSNVCKFPLKDGAEVNGMFVFGSSLVDNGNNNFLKTTARADSLPYGNDFPSGPSGRFTNGKNIIDCLGELLKLPFAIPPVKHPSTKGDRILHGVNFASAGSGILNETGALGGTVINFNEQIKIFEEMILPQLKTLLCNNNSTSGGGGSASNSSVKSSELTTFDTILSDYLFVLGVGGNDYLLNYWVVPTSRYKLMSIPQFTDMLISSLSVKIKKLYTLGGRKFVLPTVYPIGCIPEVSSMGEILKSKSDRRGCLDLVNEAARGYNTQLKSLLDELKKNLPGINFVYIDTYKTMFDIIKNPASHGFKDVSNACCQVPSLLEGGNGILCKKGSPSCKDRKTQLFFDGLHPTEAVNMLLAKQAYLGSKTDVYPFNLQQLIKSS